MSTISNKLSFGSMQQSDTVNKTKKKRRLNRDLNDESVGIALREELDEIESIEFLNSLEVLKYSTWKLDYIRQQYATELTERETTVEISSAEPLNADDYDAQNQMINKHKLWTHAIPCDVLKMIFERCIFTREYVDDDDDKTAVLILLKVCKSWRDIITNIDLNNDRHLFGLFWGGCVESCIWPRGVTGAKFCWRHLVQIPKKYLALVVALNGLERMSKEENIKYRELCAMSDGFDRFSYASGCDIPMADRNVPLLIQVLKHCPNLYSIALRGTVSKDIFIAIATWGDNIQQMQFNYCDCHDFYRNLYFLGESHLNDGALAKLKSITFERGGIEFDLSLFCTYFRGIEEIILEKKDVNGDDLYVLFNNCTKLYRLIIWRYAQPEGDWLGAFKCLTEKNEVIGCIEIDSAEGFDNECCALFLDKSVCPKLQRLWLNYVPCTQEMIDRLEEARDGVDVSMLPCPF